MIGLRGVLWTARAAAGGGRRICHLYCMRGLRRMRTAVKEAVGPGREAYLMLSIGGSLSVMGACVYTPGS